MALEIIGIVFLITGGTQDAGAQIDIPQDGIIRGIDWDMAVALDAAEVCGCEFSFISTNQLAVNDVRGRVSSVTTQAGSASGVGLPVSFVQKWVGPFELMVSGGERMFLHSVATTGVVGTVRLNLHFDGGATVTRRSARR